MGEWPTICGVRVVSASGGGFAWRQGEVAYGWNQAGWLHCTSPLGLVYRVAWCKSLEVAVAYTVGYHDATSKRTDSPMAQPAP